MFQALADRPIDVGESHILPQEIEDALRADIMTPYFPLLPPEPDGICGDFKYPGDIIYR